MKSTIKGSRFAFISKDTSSGKTQIKATSH